MKISRKAMIRDWRIRKIKLYILSLIPIIIGGVLIVQGLFAPPLKDAWKFVTGFIVCISGMLMYATIKTEYTYKKFIEKRKAR